MNNLAWSKRISKKINYNNEISICTLAYCTKYKKGSCFRKFCNKCEFSDFDKCVDYLLQEHKEPIKLKQWEYDLLDIDDIKYYRFNVYAHLNDMKKRGHFKGVTDTKMKIQDILDNGKIVPDDYDFGGNENESKEV